MGYTTTQGVSTMEQFNNLIEFRQAIYDQGLTKARDAQLELVDALLVGQPIRSYPELSLLPVFRRKWSSAYAAIEDGGQDREWLEGYFIQQLPTRGTLVFFGWHCLASLGGEGFSRSAICLQSHSSGRRRVNCGRSSLLCVSLGD